MYYSKVTIVKPKTSRMANSEKYVVFKGYKGCPSEDIDILLNIIKNQADYNKLSFFQDFETLSFMDIYIDKITEFNRKFTAGQIQSIKKTLDLLNSKEELDSALHTSVDYQVSKALEWCREYSVPINFYSNYLK